jgi:hypothetical protein
MAKFSQVSIIQSDLKVYAKTAKRSEFQSKGSEGSVRLRRLAV